jgi:hypothetical protein
VTGVNLVHLRRASIGFQFYAGVFWLAVTMVWVNTAQIVFAVTSAINLLHHGKVETASPTPASSLY